MTASIPQDKIDKALARIKIVASAARIEPKPMEELIGILQWIGQVLVRAGVHLPFAICTLKAAYKFGKATVSVALRRELEWWKQLLLQWNGTALIIDPVWIIPAHGSNDAPFTDASSDDNVGGGGGIFQKYFYACQWNLSECQTFTIYELEGFMHTLWLQWICDNIPQELAGKRFITRCDNMSFCQAVARGRSSYPVIDWLLQRIHTLQSIYSFEVRVDHVVGETNIASDALSRGYWQIFAQHLRSTNRSLAAMSQVTIPQRFTWSLKLHSLKHSEIGTRTQR